MLRKILIKNYFLAFFLIFFLTVQTAKCQENIFGKKGLIDTLKRSLDELYNFDFEKAKNDINTIRVKYPDQPAVLIFDCLFLYWKNFPLSEHRAESLLYTNTLETALTKAEVFLDKLPDDPERTFYCLFLDVLLARQNAAEDHSFAAIKYTRKAYGLIKKGFKLQNNFSEFYFSSGLYNYYREFFPEQHPFYKVISWTFPAGSKTKGLEFMDKASIQTVFVMPEALTLTSAIYLKYESNLPKALQYAQYMNKKYPNNLYFKVQYIENLIQSGLYEQAELNLAAISKANDAYYKLPIALFNGMLQERFYKQLGEAEKYYLAAIQSPKGWDTDNYIGLAYYGLGNIFKARADKEKTKTYYKKANSLCEYLSVKKETDHY